jgi:hypothetical protein
MTKTTKALSPKAQAMVDKHRAAGYSVRVARPLPAPHACYTGGNCSSMNGGRSCGGHNCDCR